MTEITVATLTYDGKDYVLERFANAMNDLIIPDDVQLDPVVFDSSRDPAHQRLLNEKLTDKVCYRMQPSGEPLREFTVRMYNEFREFAKDKPLFLVESDLIPPPNAFKAMWELVRKNPKIGVVACHTGYPLNPDGDGSEGFSNYICYHWTRESEQVYDEVKLTDVAKWEKRRPHILKKLSPRKVSQLYEFRVTNDEGKLWYQGFNEKRAIREYNKALKEVTTPDFIKRIPRYPETQLVKPDLAEPRREEGLHTGFTLIMPQVHQKIPFRVEPGEDHHLDYYFFKDCLKAGIEVWAVPIVCLHQKQAGNFYIHNRG